MDSLQAAKVIVKALDSKKAEDIRVIGIGELSVIGDYFIIASGRSGVQVKALADEIETKMSEKGVTPKRIEGYSYANWVILDYIDVIVHLFHSDTREFYSLERLWSDGEQIDIANLL
ncbi:MAG: ribosome silencing factor [Oscillospiraceae bacterium]|nr:ribosome silencing factor [Oscillospiraceae bacterium]